ncbi:hypothetical protein I4U23_022505 [Adineta vaga]|nr:hypothetical protein I4U23_022505 [Adineta vaga]
MDHRRLHSILLNLRHRLTDNDRKRLHFYLGKDAVRRIQDHPTLTGTLNLIGSLIDKDRINNKDLSYLINALDEIYCSDAANFLLEYQKRTNQFNQSIHSLSKILPPSRQNHTQSLGLHRDDNSHSEITGISKKKLLTKSSFLFVLLCLIINGELLFFSLWCNIKFRQLEDKNLGFMEVIKEMETSQHANSMNLNESEKKLKIFEDDKHTVKCLKRNYGCGFNRLGYSKVAHTYFK